MYVRLCRVTLHGWFAFPRPCPLSADKSLDNWIREWTSNHERAQPHTSSVTHGTACRLINRAWTQRVPWEEKRVRFGSTFSILRLRQSRIASRLSYRLYNTHILQRRQSYLGISISETCVPSRVSLRSIFHRYIEPPYTEKFITMHVCMHK